MVELPDVARAVVSSILTSHPKDFFNRVSTVSRRTALGNELKKLRIELGITQEIMAHRIGISASMLSAVECGVKPIPSNLLPNIVGVYNLGPEVKQVLNEAAARSTKTFVVHPKTQEERELTIAFIRRLPQLTFEEREQIRSILADQE